MDLIDMQQEKYRDKRTSSPGFSEMTQALEAAGLDWMSAARLALELAESDTRHRRGAAQMRRCRRIIQQGTAAEEQRRLPAVGMERALVSLLAARSHRRPRTLQEIEGICRRLLREIPELARRPLHSITPHDCRAWLQQVFTHPRQREKGRRILHALFNHALQQGWCRANPLSRLPRTPLTEQEIQPLTLPEIRRLLTTARRREHRACMPALGLMLWAGVRPAEVARLTWTDLDWQERVIVIRPQHAKTGGCRHITLSPVLAAWLRESGRRYAGSVCPANWQRRWRALRREAGLEPWRQDVLRHTFASYHAKKHHNFPLLQAEMGHRSAALLRTRYLSMQGITAEAAQLFWRVSAL